MDPTPSQREAAQERRTPDPTVRVMETLNREIGNLRELLEERMEGAERLGAERWSRIESMLAERSERYQERFESQEKAVQKALDSAERAVLSAFESADRAITKAEISIEKRADATYVALGELQQMLAGLMPNQEAQARFDNLGTRVEALNLNMLERANSNQSRIDKLEARTIGAKEDRTGLYAGLGAIATLLSIAAVVIAAVR